MIKIGVIGYGYWGPNLVRNFAEHPGAEMAMVVDRDPARLRRAKERHPCLRVETEAEALFAAPEIEAVAIAAPVAAHFPLALAALQAGKHVWLEKPMTETSEQARILIAEAQKRGRVLHVDHTFIFTGAVKRMKAAIDGGELGQTLYYDSTRLNLGLFQRDVGVVSDLAVHDFSILDYLFDEQPSALSASGVRHFPDQPANLAFITLFYPGDRVAHVNVSWLAPVKVRKVLLGGAEKMIVYDDLEPSEKIKIYDKGVNFTADPEEIQRRRVGYRVGDMWAPKLDETEALRTGVGHFLDRIATDIAPISCGRMGLRVVRLIEAAERSMRQRGGVVEIKPLENAA